MSSLMACIAGMVLDAIFGDPVWLYHPVRIIGNWISILEKWLRVFCKNDEKKERIAGCVLWFGVVIASNSVGTFVSCRKGQLLASICTGNFLVLSASCRKMPER